MLIITCPVPFQGTQEQARLNRETHAFTYSGFDDGDVRCDRCDCRPSYVAASYPCGEEPPQQEVTR